MRDNRLSDRAAPSSILGIDLGSRNVKLCFMNGGKILTKVMYDSIDFYREYGIRREEGFSVDLEALGYTGTVTVIATGYGRMSVSLTGARSISELKAHFLGARHQTGLDTFTLIDMGGQDYKVIHVVGGVMVDMATNDKCAASTGRYIENMAQVLGISLEEIGTYTRDPVELSSTCAIFGESEIIGHIVRGVPVPRIAAGINRAVVERVLPFFERMAEDVLVMSGGVAQNQAVVDIMGEVTGKEVLVLADPLYNGALGCCLSMSLLS